MNQPPPAPPPLPPHGTRARYNHRTAPCRDACCRDANTRYMSAYRATGGGRWRQLALPVDPRSP